MSDAIGDRFKRYERCYDFEMPRRLPLIIRVDGRSFHSLALKKPFDEYFFIAMSGIAMALCTGIQGAVLAYQQRSRVSPRIPAPIALAPVVEPNAAVCAADPALSR